MAEAAKRIAIEGWDIVVIIAYFVLVIGFGVYSSLKNRGSVGGYFLAGRSINWVLVGASLFASNIGSGHFIGLAGSGASSGIGIAVFELNAIFILMILGWVFVPVYLAADVFTMPEYMRKRFGGVRIQVYLSVLALLLYIFTKISADLYAGAVFIRQALGWDIWGAVLVLLAISAFFTIGGGLTAVIWTDFIQTVIMLVGAIVLMIISFVKVGSYGEVVDRYMKSESTVIKAYRDNPINNSNKYAAAGCAGVNEHAMHFFRPIDDSELPWLGIMAGLTISSIWYWCSDQVIVQRALAAKNLSHAKLGCVFAGYLKLFPLWLIVFPGMISRILYTDEVACTEAKSCAEICGSAAGCSNIAYPLLVIRLLGTGMRGVMLAVMMSSLMSSLTSVFNSASTMFTMDIWRRIRKRASEMELMIVGRLFVVFLVGVSIAWIPVVQGFDELFHYIQSVTSFLAPPVCAVYLLAVLWKRTNEQGAFWGLIVGLVVGLVRMCWQFAYGFHPCGEPNPTPGIIKNFHYLHFGILLWFITTVVTVCVSLVTKPIDDKHLVRLVFWSRKDDAERVDIDIALREQKRERKDGTENPALDAGISHTELDVSVTQSSEVIIENGNEPKAKTSEEPEVALPWYKTAVYWLCGIEKMQGKEDRERALTDAELKERATGHLAIVEKPMWRKVCDTNAIVLMVVAVFVWGYFA